MDLTYIQTNVVPASNTLNIGNAANQWNTVWVGNTINLNSVPITVTGNTLRVNGVSVVYSNSSANLASISVAGNTVANAVYTDNYYYANGAPFPQGSNAIPGSYISIKDNTISTTRTNMELILQGNGIGSVTLDSTTLPGIDAVYDMGSPTRRFDSMYAQYYYGNGAFLTGISGGGNANTGNWAFTGNTMYNLNGGSINNSDLSHGATAFLSLPDNGSVNAISVLNYYGNISLTVGTGPGNTSTWIFDSSGNLRLPTNSSSINYANGQPYGGGAGSGNTFSSITMTNSPPGASNVIQYGLGNLVVWNDGGWTIGEWNGTQIGRAHV